MISFTRSSTAFVAIVEPPSFTGPTPGGSTYMYKPPFTWIT